MIQFFATDRWRVFLVHVELAFPGRLEFGVYLIVKLLSPARLRAFLFCVELVSPSSFGFGVYLMMRDFRIHVKLAPPTFLILGLIVINLLFPAHLRVFIFHEELASRR